MTLVTDKYKVKTHIFIIDFNKIYIPFLVRTRWMLRSIALLQVFVLLKKETRRKPCGGAHTSVGW